MKFNIDEVEVHFPYSYIYPEQYYYMVKLKQSLDAKGACILEMPSGTGKTVCLLSLITAYKRAHPEVGKFIYCSRTVSELEKVLEEARRVIAYREQDLGVQAPKTLCLGLSSRRNLCIHPRVGEEKDSVTVDSMCRDMTASWVRDAHKVDPSVEVCSYFEGFQNKGVDALLKGVYSLQDLIALGKAQGWCPYFLARHTVNFADLVVFSYQYIIDPKIAQLITKDFQKDSIVVFDEAHNIDNVCIDALSVNINRLTLEASFRNLRTLESEITKVKESDAERLRAEYQKLVEGLAQNVVGQAPVTDALRVDPVLPDDVLQEVVPGNIRKGEHFLSLMRRFVQHLKEKLRTHQAVSETPLSFLHGLYSKENIEPKTLRFCSTRLNTLFATLQLPNLEQFTPLSIVADFATLVGTYSKGFLLIIDPTENTYQQEPMMQFSCLDASLAIQPVLAKFRSVVITSGTISPIDMYTKILNFTPVVAERFSMSLARTSVCPLIVTRGSDQTAMTSRFDVRSDPAVVRNFGDLLVDVSAVVPDGIVCFFTSYSYMEEIVSTWNDMGLLNTVLTNKLLFVETPDPGETALALENYKKACDSGRGAVLFSVARGKVSEGIDFDHQYGRAVILFGIPYLNTQSKILKARLEFLRDHYQIREGEFLTFDAMRVASQCVGRVIRGKTDYGIMIFADKRYNRTDKRSKLPQWIGNFVTSNNTNLSTEMCTSLAKKFLQEMTHPYSREQQLGKDLWTHEQLLEKQKSGNQPAAPR
jgi:DNA excision repair protein ERCC-2